MDAGTGDHRSGVAVHAGDEHAEAVPAGKRRGETRSLTHREDVVVLPMADDDRDTDALEVRTRDR